MRGRFHEKNTKLGRGTKEHGVTNATPLPLPEQASSDLQSEKIRESKDSND
jgi:hypothetical protein